MDYLLHLLLEPLPLCTVQNKALEGLLIWGFWFFSLLGCFDRGPFHSQLLQLFLHRPVLLVQQIGQRLLKSVWAQAEPKGINVWFNNDSCLFRTLYSVPGLHSSGVAIPVLLSNNSSLKTLSYFHMKVFSCTPALLQLWDTTLQLLIPGTVKSLFHRSQASVPHSRAWILSPALRIQTTPECITQSYLISTISKGWTQGVISGILSPGRSPERPHTASNPATLF